MKQRKWVVQFRTRPENCHLGAPKWREFSDILFHKVEAERFIKQHKQFWPEKEFRVRVKK